MKIDTNKLYTTREVAKIFRVSIITIKRYIANGQINSIKFNGLRRIKGEEIEKILNQKSNNKKMIKQKRHPRHYKIHRYWGRKSSGLVSHFIEKYTEKGDTVLDPFVGSGVTVIESKKMDRNSCGIDISPLSQLIINGTLIETDLNKIEEIFNNIINKIPTDLLDLQITLAPSKRKSKIIAWIWNQDKLEKIRAYNDTDGEFLKKPSKSDLEKINTASNLLKKYDSKIKYPKEPILKFVRRSGKKTINELFSDRNILILGFILGEIESIRYQKYKIPLKLVFSSSLINSSLMIPADIEKARGKSGWQISKIWIPKTHIEKNVIITMRKKLGEYIKAKEEIDPLLSKSKHILYTQSAESIKKIKNESIDYVFTDPPYGDTIAYLGLNMFWNAWVCPNVCYEKEIIYDRYRNKDYDSYYNGLKKVYSEMNRVLKKNAFMTFTFNARNLKFWKIILDATLESGFKVENVEWVDQAASSGTQGINKKNTMKGDFVYTFKKTDKISEFQDKDGRKIMITFTEKLIKKNKGFIEVHQLYEQLLPVIIEKRAFLDNDEIMDIEKLLAENFKYSEKKYNNKIAYGWQKK